MKQPQHSLLLLLLLTSTGAFPPNPPLSKHRRQQEQTRSITTASRLFATSAHIDRNVYKPEKIADKKYDVIVIGSGIGGLTAASLIAQSKKKVLVLEQHYVAGGACHTFERQAGKYRFATGIHYVGEMEDNDNQKGPLQVSLKRLLDNVASTNDPIQWDRMKDPYETVFIGNPPQRYDIVAGQENLEQKLVTYFPNEQTAISKYYKLANKIRQKAGRVALLKCLPLSVARILTKTRLYRLFVGGTFSKYSKTSVKDGLGDLTPNMNLQALLAYNYADYGTEPNEAPYWMQLMLATHYLEGAYYPRGGPSNIARSIIQCINDNGGDVMVSAPVERILVDRDDDDGSKTPQVRGVKLKDGNIISCETIISDAGFINTVSKLLPDDIVVTGVDFAHPGPTGINLFVGLDKDAASLNLPASNVWIHPSNDLSATAEKLNSMTLEQALECEDGADLGLIFVGCPSTKDSDWGTQHPNTSVLEIISFLPWRWFEPFAHSFDKKTRSHGPEYEAAKTTIAKKQWERVVQTLNTEMGARLPDSLDDVDFYEIGSPLTFAHYYNAKEGAFYGLDNDMKRFEPRTFFLRLRPEVPEVNGLYLSGQDVICDGLGPSMLGGLLCARKVLGITNPTSLVK